MNDKTADDRDRSDDRALDSTGQPIVDGENVNEAIGSGALRGAAVGGPAGGSSLGDVAGAPPGVVGADQEALDQNKEAEDASASRR